MADPYSVEGMFAALDAARTQKEALLKGSEAARKKRDDLVARMAPLEAELRGVNEEIKKLHAPGGPDADSALYHVDQKIATLARALSGKVDPRKPRESAKPAA